MPARPSMPGHRHAIDIGLADAGHRRQRLAHLAGGDILALPAEGVADAVDEIEIAVAVAPHQVAGAKPDIAASEHVAQHLLLAVGLVGIALELPPGRAGNAAHRFAHFVGRAFDAKPVRRRAPAFPFPHRSGPRGPAAAIPDSPAPGPPRRPCRHNSAWRHCLRWRHRIPRCGEWRSASGTRARFRAAAHCR